MYKYIHVKKESEIEREREEQAQKKSRTVIYHKFITILVESYLSTIPNSQILFLSTRPKGHA